MHMQTQFGIPTSNNIGVMLRARLYLKRGQGQQGHSDPKWCATSRNLKTLTQTKFGFLPQIM